MIKADELRLGNYVLNDSGKFIEIGYEYFILIGNGNKYNDNWEPIPLTPEILEKLNINPLWVRCDNDIWLDDNVQISSCKHLHQLQNLYFALTGDELEINLQK